MTLKWWTSIQTQLSKRYVPRTTQVWKSFMASDRNRTRQLSKVRKSCKNSDLFLNEVSSMYLLQHLIKLQLERSEFLRNSLKLKIGVGHIFRNLISNFLMNSDINLLTTCILDFEQLQPPVLESSSIQLLHQEQSSNIVTFHVLFN